MKDVDSIVSCFHVPNFNHLCREQNPLLWQNVLDSWALIFKAVGELRIRKVAWAIIGGLTALFQQKRVFHNH